MGVQLEPFVIEDVVAIATLIQGIFAGGGGNEHKNVLLLQVQTRCSEVATGDSARVGVVDRTRGCVPRIVFGVAPGARDSAPGEPEVGFRDGSGCARDRKLPCSDALF